MEGGGLTTILWTGLWGGRSEWSLGSGVSAGFGLSQTPFVQLTRYGSLGEVLTSLSLNFVCEVRIKLVYPKGSQVSVGTIGLNVDAPSGAPSTSMDLSFLRLPGENWVSIWPPAISDGDVTSAGFFLRRMPWTLIIQDQQEPIRDEAEKSFHCLPR